MQKVRRVSIVNGKPIQLTTQRQLLGLDSESLRASLQMTPSSGEIPVGQNVHLSGSISAKVCEALRYHLEEPLAPVRYVFLVVCFSAGTMGWRRVDAQGYYRK